MKLAQQRRRRLFWQRNAVRIVFYIIILALTIWAFMHPSEVSPKPQEIKIVPVAMAAQVTSPKPTPKVYSVEEDIKEVFGSNSNKAFLLLRGNGDTTCRENDGLDPTLEHENKDEFGKVTSTDYGVFQINSKWQGVSNIKFLKDPAINIRIAYRIFVDDGYSFKLWTCGRAYGI